MIKMIDISKKTIRKCCKNNRNSQKEIYEKLYPRIMPISMRYSNCKDDALDLMQDSFIKVFKNIHKFKHNGSFEGWVKRIVVNTAIDNFRLNKKRMRDVPYSNEILYDKPNEEIDESILMKYEDISPTIIMNELQSMSAGYRNVFNLYIMEEYTHREISEKLGISEGTSKSNLHKARKIMCNKLKKYIKYEN